MVVEEGLPLAPEVVVRVVVVFWEYIRCPESDLRRSVGWEAGDMRRGGRREEGGIMAFRGALLSES